MGYWVSDFNKEIRRTDRGTNLQYEINQCRQINSITQIHVPAAKYYEYYKCDKVSLTLFKIWTTGSKIAF